MRTHCSSSGYRCQGALDGFRGVFKKGGKNFSQITDSDLRSYGPRVTLRGEGGNNIGKLDRKKVGKSSNDSKYLNRFHNALKSLKWEHIQEGETLHKINYLDCGRSM